MIKVIYINKVIREIEERIVKEVDCVKVSPYANWNHALILAIQIIKDNIKEKLNYVTMDAISPNTIRIIDKNGDVTFHRLNKFGEFKKQDNIKEDSIEEFYTPLAEEKERQKNHNQKISKAMDISVNKPRDRFNQEIQ